MAVTPIAFPNIIPDTLEFGIKYNTQVSTTSLSGITQTVELPGARWAGQMTFRDLSPADSAALKVFLLKLRGSSGRFYFGDLTHTLPFDSDITDSVLTIESTSGPRTIDVTTSAGSFAIGDYIQVGDDDEREYKMVVGVTGSSPQSLTIEPMMRRIDYAGQTLIYSNPTGIFLLDADDLAKWSVRSKAKLSDIAISFVEGYT